MAILSILMRRVSLLGLLAVLAGCASTTPNPVASAPPGAVSLAEVGADPSAFVGRPVRWGGTLVGVRNRNSSSVLEILSRPLSGNGLPDIDGQSSGRFLAVIAGFVDPAAHASGTRVTVIGRVSGSEHGRIGEYDYHYPVVAVDSWRDWGVYREPVPVRDPFCCSPWGYDPWYWGYPGYGWWGYPYYPRHHSHRSDD